MHIYTTIFTGYGDNDNLIVTDFEINQSISLIITLQNYLQNNQANVKSAIYRSKCIETNVHELYLMFQLGLQYNIHILFIPKSR